MQISMNQMANGMNIMNQNLFKNNQFQGNNQQQSNAFVTIKFRDSRTSDSPNTDDDGHIIAIQCKPDEKESEIIQRYRTKADFHDEVKFVFNAKNWSPSLSVAEAGITNGAIVFVVRTKHVKVAYYYSF